MRSRNDSVLVRQNSKSRSGKFANSYPLDALIVLDEPVVGGALVGLIKKVPSMNGAKPERNNSYKVDFYLLQTIMLLVGRCQTKKNSSVLKNTQKHLDLYSKGDIILS